MSNSKIMPKDAKEVFMKCGTCSQTFGHLLNHAFDHPMTDAERALDPLAGGIMNRGHQCGMLWGAALAAGAEAAEQNKNAQEAMGAAVKATQALMDSFQAQTNTISCREITGCDLTTSWGMAKLMLMTFLGGIKNSRCFNMAEKWAPEAIKTAEESLATAGPKDNSQILSCASEVLAKMGGSEKEQIMVAGFAGGLGLSGSGCGALSAALWMKALSWCRENPGKTPPFFSKDKALKGLLERFIEFTEGEIECHKICGRKFENLEDHSNFLQQEGCASLIRILAKS